MYSWAFKEVSTLEIGDVRRPARIARMLERLCSKPGLSVPQACQSKAEMNAMYYAWNSEHITPQAILGSHRDATVERIRPLATVLVANDTTNLNLSTHDSIEELGYLDNKKGRGLLAHTAFAVTTEGLPLGLLHQECWSRLPDELGKKKTRKKRETEEKESKKWLTALDAICQAVPETTTAVVIGDRESDIYAYFAHPREAHVELLVRSAQNRRVEGNAYLHDAVRSVLPCGTLTVEVPRADNRPVRTAKLTLRYTTVSILPPSDTPKKKGLKPVSVQVVLAEEETPPEGASPISWLLLTTLPVSNAGQATQCVAYYRQRWLIERFHFVLKSGCKVEQLQLCSLDAFETALATFNIVAWRLLHLTYQVRLTPDVPCDLVFEQAEWEALCVRVNKKSPPRKPPTLRDAVRMVAQLGGFLGRKGDGEPGVKTLWLGLAALHECVETYAAMREISPPRQHLQTFRES